MLRVFTERSEETSGDLGSCVYNEAVLSTVEEGDHVISQHLTNPTSDNNHYYGGP